MSEAFEIGVTLALSDGVSEGIARARRDVAAFEQVLHANGVSVDQLRAAAVGALSPLKNFSSNNGTLPLQTPPQRGGPAPTGIKADASAVPEVHFLDRGGLDMGQGGVVPVAPGLPQFSARSEIIRGASPSPDSTGQPRTKTPPLQSVAGSDSSEVSRAFAATQLMPSTVVHSWAGKQPSTASSNVMQAPVRAAPPTTVEKRVSAQSTETPPPPPTYLAKSVFVSAPAGYPESSSVEPAPRAASAPVTARTAGGMPITPLQLGSQESSEPSAAMLDSQPSAWASPRTFLPSAPPRMPSAAGGGQANSETSETHSVGTDRAGPTEGDVYLDGMLVGRWISRFLAQEAARASVGPTGYDGRRGRLLPGPTVGN